MIKLTPYQGFRSRLRGKIEHKPKEVNDMKARTTIFTALAAILLVGMVIVPAMGLQISSQDGSTRTDAFEDRAL